MEINPACQKTSADLEPLLHSSSSCRIVWIFGLLTLGISGVLIVLIFTLLLLWRVISYVRPDLERYIERHLSEIGSMLKFLKS
ncbi:MAG: hypothetical protein JSR33_02700 [Proteobacteria bacterium]|nr:hypothetical protein [Pseudomonadota bacterium]